MAIPESAASQLKKAAAQGNVLLLLNRQGMSQFVGLSVENNGTAGSSRWVARILPSLAEVGRWRPRMIAATGTEGPRWCLR